MDELKQQIMLLKTELAALKSVIRTSSNHNTLNINAGKNLQLIAGKDIAIEAADEITLKSDNALIIQKRMVTLN